MTYSFIPPDYPDTEPLFDWMLYQKQEENPKYGGNISSGTMSGEFGEYYLTEGYFLCFNPYHFNNADEIQIYQ